MSDIAVIAKQVFSPMNPTSPAVFTKDVFALPGGTVRFPPTEHPATVRDALIHAARSAAGGGAVGVFQARSGALHLQKLATYEHGGYRPVTWGYQMGGPIGSPVTTGFERTSFGAGLAGQDELKAIVGIDTYADFSTGEFASLEELTGVTIEV